MQWLFVVIIMYDQPIKLITAIKKGNQYGDSIETTSEREVFAQVKSIGQAEFYQAKAIGMKPEIKFVLADYLEYQGETKLKYQDYGESEEKEYAIIRTFRKGNELEIVCKRGGK